jgi:hypothetical protein
LKLLVSIFEHHESVYLIYIVALVLADAIILVTLPNFVRDTAISQISAVFVTVEGVLIGLTPQIRYKKLRDIVAFVGIISILISVLTFMKSTYEAVQLGYLSLDVTTLLFKSSGALFLGFVELYAIAILSPFTAKDLDKAAVKRIAEAW